MNFVKGNDNLKLGNTWVKSMYISRSAFVEAFLVLGSLVAPMVCLWFLFLGALDEGQWYPLKVTTSGCTQIWV